jgi:hypothetical protein
MMMSRFEVAIRQIEVYSVEVEAEDEQEAEDKAWELVMNDRDEYHIDSDASTKVYQLSNED